MQEVDNIDFQLPIESFIRILESAVIASVLIQSVRAEKITSSVRIPGTFIALCSAALASFSDLSIAFNRSCLSSIRF